MNIVKTPLRPRHPERVCWGCDRYCPADDMVCGNGKVRSPHPIELFGDDVSEWVLPYAQSAHERGEPLATLDAAGTHLVPAAAPGHTATVEPALSFGHPAARCHITTA